MEAIAPNQNNLASVLRPQLDELRPQGRRAPVDGLQAQEATDHDVPDSPENRQKVESAVRVLDAMQTEGAEHNRFRFHVHQGSGKIQVSVVNYLTGEVIQEVPSSKMIEFSQRMQELTGLLLDKRG